MRVLWNRLKLMLGTARVSLVDDSATVQMIQAKISTITTRDNTPRMAEFGFTSNPPIGSDVAIACIGGDRSNAFVIATGHQASRPTGLAPGETMLYSQDGKSVYLTASGGIVVDANAQAVTVNNATLVTINAASGVKMNTPLLEVSGDIIDNNGTNTHTIAEMRSIYNGHTHSDPQGGATGTPSASQ